MAFAAIGTAAAIGGGLKALGGVAKFFGGRAAKKKAQAEQKKAKAEMEAKKKQYEALDTSNTFKNMENKMEDLTIDQKGAQFAAQKGQQARANIMQQMQGAAGGSGIAALAQTMANEGQLAAQTAGEKIGVQEAANQAKTAEAAAQIQTQEMAGEQVAQQREMDKQGTLLGMAQQRVGAANQAEAQAQSQMMGGIGDFAGGVASAFMPAATAYAENKYK